MKKLSLTMFLHTTMRRVSINRVLTRGLQTTSNADLNTSNRLINISLIGRPASGKGTYGSLLAEKLKIPLVIVGDVLRDHVAKGTEIGIAIENCQKEGKLADDELVTAALLSHLKTLKSRATYKSNKAGNDVQFGYILDGYPRSLVQAETMYTSSSLPWPKEFEIAFAVDIDVPDKICIDKMLGRRKCTICKKSFNVADVNTKDGYVMPPNLPDPFPCTKCDMDKDWERRLDDTEDIMTARLKEFHAISSPVVKFFQQRNKLVKFQPFNGISDMPLMEDLVRNRAMKEILK